MRRAGEDAGEDEVDEMSASKGERSGETTGETAARLLAIHDQIGHVDDDLRQPDAIPLARAWIEHWAELLVDSPRSAAGPLASLLTDVRRSERATVTAALAQVAAAERFIVRYRDRAGFLRERDDLDGVSLVGLDPGPTVYESRERAEAARLRALDLLGGGGMHDAEMAALLVVVPHPALVAPAPTPAPTPARKSGTKKIGTKIGHGR